MDIANATPDGSMVDAPPPPIPAAKKSPNLSAALQVEQQLMRLPFEGFKKQVRVNNRVVEKEVNSVVAGVAEASSKSLSQDEAVRQLRGLVSRLQGLKRKVWPLTSLTKGLYSAGQLIKDVSWLGHS